MQWKANLLSAKCQASSVSDDDGLEEVKVEK
jgi:hypothetical protein